MIEYLKGHVSADTAVIVNDYPYGFRLRCKIRYWLEYKPGKGFRLWSQTTNPKRPFGALNLATGERSEYWNKAKTSTFIQGAATLYRDTETGHIRVSDYDFRRGEVEAMEEFLFLKRNYLPKEFIPIFERHIAVVKEYNRLKATGMDYRQAGIEAVKATL